MAVVETECLVIKTYNLAEADKIVVLLTRDHGVIRGVAKGAKRLKSRFGSALEPFSVSRVEYFEKETSDLVSLQRSDLIASNFFVASDPLFLQKFSYLAELIIAFSPPNDPNEKLFRMSLACIETARNDKDAIGSIGVYFESWLLRISGFLPDWANCGLCGRQIADSESAGVLSDMHLHCLACRRPSKDREFPPISRRMMAVARRRPPTEFAAEFKANKSQLEGLSAVLRQMVSRSLGKDAPGEISLSANIAE